MENDLPQIEVVEHQGKKYQRIESATINLEEMTPIQKVTNVFAYQVASGKTVEVETWSDGVLETVNTANAGDWVVYNIGNGVGKSLQEKLNSCDKKIISTENFSKLYGEKTDEEGDASDVFAEDGSSFADYDDAVDYAVFKYTGKPIYAARVGFNFVIKAPWGEEQFIEAGGYVIYNTNTSNDLQLDIYGTSGAKDRKAGQLCNTYSKLDAHREGTISDTFKMVIKADRSPIAGIQFNSRDLERAHDRIGVETQGWEHKY